MIRKYRYGAPFPTEAVVQEIPVTAGEPPFGKVHTEQGFLFTYVMTPDTIIYGLGEANRGINKRGYRYVSWCSDDPIHTEQKVSLYGAHNFLVVAGEKPFGLFFDYPSELTFDIGYTKSDIMTVSCGSADLDVYVIEEQSPYEIVRRFRSIIGRSYIPPKFAFGFGQSRWGYRTRDDFEEAADGYRSNHIPLDMIYMDIDYMDHYKDFTVNPECFPDFTAFVRKMKERNIRMIPIIDAGVKIEPGYSVYEDGVKNGYFCRRADGSDFEAAVWPGYCHFTDVLNPEARAWFGDQYRFLTDQGIEGFWNDMNEPAIFYSREGMTAAKRKLLAFAQEGDDGEPVWDTASVMGGLANSRDDYQRFYHLADGKAVCHEKVHNLYGYYMTRAAGEALERLRPGQRTLLFSRSSYIGMHRYGGVWTGDNASWWTHILLNLKMMPSLNMCGFLYIGADIGGFNCDVTRDLLLRWLALGVFTPLMRNHSALGTRKQECYRFEHTEDFAHVIGVRYRLIPYLYSEFMKAALEDDLYFKPLAFVYQEDSMAAQAEDQLMIGGEIMIAPVYVQNAAGRYVYLPEEMMFVKFLPDGTLHQEVMAPGHHYVEIALNEVPLFIRRGKCIPLAEAAESVEQLDTSRLTLVGYDHAEYTLYEDDGIHQDYDNPKNRRVLVKA